MNKLVSTEKLMEILDVSRSTLYRYRLEGLPHVKVSYRVIRYDLQEVKKWLDENKY